MFKVNFDTILVTFEPSKEFVLQFHLKYVFFVYLVASVEGRNVSRTRERHGHVVAEQKNAE